MPFFQVGQKSQEMNEMQKKKKEERKIIFHEGIQLLWRSSTDELMKSLIVS